MGQTNGANGQMATMLHKYKSGQSQITSNGVNPSSSFSGMPSSPWAYLYRSNSMTLPNYKSKQFHRTFKGTICPVVSKICILQSLGPNGTRFKKLLAYEQAHMRQASKMLHMHNLMSKQSHRILKEGHSMVSEVCIPLESTGIRIDSFYTHELAHIGQVGKWLWYCTTSGLNTYITLIYIYIKEIHLAVSMIYIS